MLGNRLLDFVKGNTFNKSENDWFANLSKSKQDSARQAIKDYNKFLKSKGPNLDIDRWEQFSEVSDDVRTYLKSLDETKASTEDLNKSMSKISKTASNAGTEFITTGSKIKDFGLQTKNIMEGFGNVVTAGLKSFGKTVLSIGGNLALNAGIGLALDFAITKINEYIHTQDILI